MTRRRVRLQETLPNRGAGVFECACHLGITESRFVESLPKLQKCGFPSPHPILGTYDMKAVDLWFDKESGIGAPLGALGNVDHRRKIVEWAESA